jgi:hypothetical protein
VSHQRAVARRFFLHDRLNINSCCRLQTGAAKRIQRENIGGMTDFHVRTAATVEPIAIDDRFEWRMAPHRGGPCRDHVNMCLEDQRPSFLLTRTMNSDNDRRARMLIGEWRAARVPLDGLLIHLEPVHGIAAVTKRAKNEILNGVLRTAYGWKADEILREGYLLTKSLTDRRDDAVTNAGVDRHRGCPFEFAF